MLYIISVAYTCRYVYVIRVALAEREWQWSLTWFHVGMAALPVSVARLPSRLAFCAEFLMMFLRIASSPPLFNQVPLNPFVLSHLHINLEILGHRPPIPFRHTASSCPAPQVSQTACRPCCPAESAANP